MPSQKQTLWEWCLTAAGQWTVDGVVTGDDDGVDDDVPSYYSSPLQSVWCGGVLWPIVRLL